MFHTNEEFLGAYNYESATTAKVLGALTDAALSLAKAAGHDTLGDIAWHIATAPTYILAQCEWPLPQLGHEVPAELSAAKIQATYADISTQVKAIAATKSPADLQQVFNFFGMFDWPVQQVLAVTLSHEIHHRGQISVLMRQAGIVVPSIYGPNKEETDAMTAARQQA